MEWATKMKGKSAASNELISGPFGVLSVGVGMVVVIYSLAGFFGFLAYGNDVQDSITLNLPNDQ